jgi:hypothetical protein
MLEQFWGLKVRLGAMGCLSGVGEKVWKGKRSVGWTRVGVVVRGQ